MLLGFVVLVEVDARSVVVLHGVAGQQLSEKHTHYKHDSFNSVNIHAPPLYDLKIIIIINHSCDVTTGGRTLTRLIHCLDVSTAQKVPSQTFIRSTGAYCCHST